MVRKDDYPSVKEKVDSYKKYQKGLAKVRKINKEIDHIFEEIKKTFLEEYK
ncbi:MAG: hypothetical protein ABIA04_05035 [Pseudomonadota bacterium]